MSATKVFGGLGLGVEGEPRALGDTWTLVTTPASSLASASRRWKRPMVQGGAPARRWGHAACMMGGSGSAAMLLCGGTTAPGQPLSDCWVLHLGDMRWEEVDVVPMQLPMGRTLLPGGEALCAAGPPELGCCTVAWSDTHQAAIIWGGEGFWVWREPEQLRWQREKSERLAERQPQAARVRPERPAERQSPEPALALSWPQRPAERWSPEPAAAPALGYSAAAADADVRPGKDARDAR